MSTVIYKSIFSYVLAPAPRYLMRLALIEKLARLLPESTMSFLEIGPGLGDISLFLSEKFPDACGEMIDISAKSVAMVRQRTASVPRLSVMSGDFRNLQSREAYDLILACEVFEHLEDDESAFDATNRLLKRGGYFIFSVPAFMRKWQAGDEYAGHYRRYERSQLIEKFIAHGLKILRLWCYGFPVTQLLSLPYRIYYGRKLSIKPLSKTEATKRSGVERPSALKFCHVPILALLKPCFVLQNMFKTTDIGDGYLVLAQK